MTHANSVHLVDGSVVQRPEHGFARSMQYAIDHSNELLVTTYDRPLQPFIAAATPSPGGTCTSARTTRRQRLK